MSEAVQRLEPVRFCPILQMELPETMFGAGPNSKLGNLWVNVSQRAVNGRYADSRKGHYPRNNHHRKGVQMLDEWVNDPSKFGWYILTQLGFPQKNAEGYKLSLDRIDNDGDYVPGNLRWATAFEQACNTGPVEY